MSKKEFDLTQLGTMSEKRLAALEAKLSAKVEKMDADLEKIATEKSELQKSLAATQKVIDFTVGKELVKEARKANIAIRKSDIPRIIGFLKQEQNKEVSLSEPAVEKNDKQISDVGKEEVIKKDEKKKIPESKTSEKVSAEENEDSPVLKKILARNEAEKKQVEESKAKQSPTQRMTISDKFR